jgi:hypothetical protein
MRTYVARSLHGLVSALAEQVSQGTIEIVDGRRDLAL